eukprot:1615261-Prymnesium_polylepis.1
MFVQPGQSAARPSKKRNAASTDACDASPRQKRQQCTGDAGAKNTIEVLDSDSLRAAFLCLQIPTLRRVKSVCKTWAAAARHVLTSPEFLSSDLNYDG